MMGDAVMVFLAVALRFALPLVLLLALVGVSIMIARRGWRTSYRGGDLVAPGFYWNPRRVHFAAILERTGILPGGRSEHFIRMPTVLALAAAPLLGLLYVVLLPAAIVCFLAYTIGRNAYRKARAPASAPAPAKEKGAPY